MHHIFKLLVGFVDQNKTKIEPIFLKPQRVNNKNPHNSSLKRRGPARRQKRTSEIVLYVVDMCKVLTLCDKRLAEGLGGWWRGG